MTIANVERYEGLQLIRAARDAEDHLDARIRAEIAADLEPIRIEHVMVDGRMRIKDLMVEITKTLFCWDGHSKTPKLATALVEVAFCTSPKSTAIPVQMTHHCTRTGPDGRVWALEVVADMSTASKGRIVAKACYHITMRAVEVPA